jgi:hypothetical protein
VSRDDFTGEPFASRAVFPEVAEERGYTPYEKPADVREADPRMGGTQELKNWTRHYGSRGAPGWVMKKHALPGSAFDAPLPQLRPDKAVPGRKEWHDHAWAFYNRPVARKIHERAAHESQHTTGRHFHVPESKYLIAPGPHGKRWDTHPSCTADRFMSAERVFLHMEGTLKLDALVSAGEVGADVPSVTLWDRRGALSWADWPGGKPEVPDGVGFWDYYEEGEKAMEDATQAQADELGAFLRGYVRAPVIIVCDRDHEHPVLNPAVALEAFCLRDVVRDAGLPCVVAAPPRGGDSRVKGSDDFQYAGGKPGEMVVVEPLPHKAPGRATFERLYRRGARGPSGRRRPAEVVDRDLELLDWYAAHSAAEGFVARPASRIAKRLGVKGRDTVKRATVRLAQAGALVIDGHYDNPDERPRRTTEEWRALGRGRRQAIPTMIRLREDLRPELWEPAVGSWLRAQG